MTNYQPLWSTDLSEEGTHSGTVLCRCHGKWVPADSATFGTFNVFQTCDHWCRDYVKGRRTFRTYEEINSEQGF